MVAGRGCDERLADHVLLSFRASQGPWGGEKRGCEYELSRQVQGQDVPVYVSVFTRS